MPSLNTTAMAGAVARWLTDNFVDQFTTSRALYEFLRQKDRIKFGGAYLVAPVFGSKNSSAAGISNFYSALTFPSDNGMAAEYTWSWYHAITAISPPEELVANTKDDMANIVESKLRSSINSIAETIYADLWSTTIATQAKVNGLPFAVDNTGNLGGIDATANTWWRATKNTTAASLSLTLVNKAINAVQDAGGMPDLIVTTSDLYASFEALVQPAQIITDAKMAQAGFQAIIYKGCTVLHDPQCPAGNLFVLSSRDLYLAMSDQKPSVEPIPPGITPSKGFYHKIAAQLCFTRRNTHYRYTALS